MNVFPTLSPREYLFENMGAVLEGLVADVGALCVSLPCCQRSRSLSKLRLQYLCTGNLLHAHKAVPTRQSCGGSCDVYELRSYVQQVET